MKLPGYTGKVDNIVKNHDTEDIIELLLSKDGIFVDQVYRFCEPLQNMPVEDACREIYNALRQNVTYKADAYFAQNLKSPARLFHDRVGDCKSFSLFAGTCLRVLNIPYAYRFVSFDRSDKTPTHVYAVANPSRNEIIIDAVLPKFNYQKPYTYKKDKVMLSFLSGVPSYNEGSYLTTSYARKTAYLGDLGPVITTGSRTKVFDPNTKVNKMRTMNDSGGFNAEAADAAFWKKLNDLQKQKQQIADNTALSYADRKKQIDVIQAKQNVIIKQAFQDLNTEIKNSLKNDPSIMQQIGTAIDGMVSNLVSMGANSVIPGSGIAINYLTQKLNATYLTNKLVDKVKAASVKFMLAEATDLVKPYLADSFPFYQEDYKKQQAATGVKGQKTALTNHPGINPVDVPGNNAGQANANTVLPGNSANVNQNTTFTPTKDPFTKKPTTKTNTNTNTGSGSGSSSGMSATTKVMLAAAAGIGLYLYSK